MNIKVFGALLLSTSVASANGFVINEHDATATGRGNATVATDESPASIVYNPGGVAVGAGTNVAVSATLITANGSYTDTNGMKTSTDGGPAYLPAAFMTHRVNDYVSVGIGFHLPFGLAISWPESSPQNEVIQKQSLRTYFITPVVGVNLGKILPGLSFGGGVDLVPSTVEFERALIFGDTQGTAKLGGDAFGVGARLGAQYKPAMVQGLSLGAMWRSKVTLDFEGKGDFDIEPGLRGQLPPDGDISTTLVLPQSIAGGVAYRKKQIEVELDAVWMQWSVFKDLVINLPDDTTTTTPENYKDTVSIRLGAEYDVKTVPLSIRAGYVYDPTPIPNTTVSAQLPDVDRHVLTAGASYGITSDYGVSLGLLTVLPAERKTSDEMYQPFHKGTYGVSAFVMSASFNGRFGAN